MNNSQFSLVDILRQIFQKKAFVILIAVIAALIAFAFCKLQTPKYTSKTTFIVKNPILLDRSFVFNPSTNDKSLFASPDDVDQVKSIAESEDLPMALIKTFNLQNVYHTADTERLIETVQSNLSFVMKDSKNVELSYTDAEPARAAAIANAARQAMEEVFINYFVSSDKDIIKVLQRNSDSLQANVTMLNDSIKYLRGQLTGIDQLLPTRNLILTNSTPGASHLEHSLMESLSEKISMKDGLIVQIVNYGNLMQQYKALANNEIKVFYVVQKASVVHRPSSPKTPIVVLASAIASVFFSSMLIVLRNSYTRNFSPRKQMVREPQFVA